MGKTVNVKISEEHNIKFHRLMGFLGLEAIKKGEQFKMTKISTLEKIIDLVWEDKVEPKRKIGFHHEAEPPNKG